MSVSFRRLAAACSVALLPFLSPFAQSLVVQDGGAPRTFELALDEVAVQRPGQPRTLTAITPAATGADLRAYAAQRSRATGEKVELVLHEVVDGRRAGAPRIVTSRVLFRVQPGADPVKLAVSLGAAAVTPSGVEGLHVAVAADSAAALDLAAALRAAPGVASADPLLARRQTKKLVPNDPLFPLQWHLNNTGQSNGTAGVDVRITNTWDTYRGTNIYIGIIDDGVQTAHPDLAANMDTTIDWDFNFNDNDPNHTFAEDGHGTSCAGVAAAVGNNALGVSGAAPEARLVGLRLISDVTDDTDEAAAINWSNTIIHIKSNSWGPSDTGTVLEGPGPLTEAAMSNACFLGRGGRGVLIFWAGGNGGDVGDDSNYDGYANSIYSIAVGAVANTGIQSWYSEPGANLVVCAPSSGDNLSAADVGIMTTDRTGANGYAAGDYTGDFGGTSSATPLAAGVGALVLQSNTNLTWRDMQEILIRSATRNHPGDTDWRANAAGIWFNHKYGGGMVSASGAVAMASTWTNLGPQVRATYSQTGLSVAIPDNNPAGISRTFLVTNNIRVEHAVLAFSATHPYRGDLRIELVSPGNTTSVLADAHNDGGDNYSNWRFMTVRNWGELAAGTWTLRVADLGAADVGTLTAASLTVYGTSTAAPSNQPPVIAPIGNQTVVETRTLAFAVSATDLVDGHAITLTASNLPAGASFGATNGAGSFLWSNAGPIGVYTARFYAADIDGTTTQAVVITCLANQPPVLAPIGNKVGIVSNTLAFSVFASDPAGDDPITLTASNLPPGASFGATNGTGSFSWPDASPTGTYAVSFHAADVAGTDAEAITITVIEQPPFVTYAETFDTTANWGGGLAGSYNLKSYINNAAAPEGDGFSANSALRETTFSVTSNAWRIGNDSTANLYFRYALSNSVTRFAMQLARWDNSPTPNFVIRYSLDSGANYTTLFSTNGSWFSADQVYQAYDSGPLNLVAVPGQQIWIELFRSTGERMLIDNFEVDYIPLDGPPAQTPPTLNAIGAKSVTAGNTLAFGVTATPTDGDTVTLTASNLPAGATFGSTNQTGAFSWINAGPAGVYTAVFFAADNDGVDSEAVVITVNAAGGGSNGLNTILFQGFEPGDGWTIDAGSANISTNSGATNTPPNQRIRSGTNSWQVSNGNRTLVLAQASISGYTQRVVQVRNSSISGGAANGADGGDNIRVFVALDGAAFSSTPDVIVAGNSNARWGFWATNQVLTTAGTLVSNAAPQAGTSSNNYANLFISIPDSATSIALRVTAVNNDANEIWCIDDITVAGSSAAPPNPDSDADGLADQWEIDNFGSITNSNGSADFDNDGFIDLHEYLAGTQPTNAASLLEVDNGTAGNGTLLIQWPGVSGKSYLVSRSTNLLTGAYVPVASNIPGVEPLVTYTTAAPAEAGSVYRIELE